MTTKRIREEQQVVEAMIRLYCRKYERHETLCPDCQALLNYAYTRLSRCRWGEQKPTCKQCSRHCYRPDMKERMRTVMRWAGPRMLFYHPMMALRHMFREMR